MEKMGALERESIISILSEGKALTNELKRKLEPAIDSRVDCDDLLENILSSYENAIQLLNCAPLSIECSPTSEGSDLNSKDQPHKCKRRKTRSKWSEQVRLRSETGSEGQLVDGYNWRKYGQKDILGATHPRAYYRCTHRHTQGCLATKQVQRVDADPSIFDVVYRGKHSCMQETLKQNKEDLIMQIKVQQESTLITTHQPYLKAENQELVTKGDPFSSFSFPSTPIESENLKRHFFPEPKFLTGTEIYSPREFLSPATSMESYFSMPLSPVNEFTNDFSEIISNPTPFTNLSFRDLDISIDQIDFSSQLLDAIEFF